MERKKNPKVDLSKNSGLYFSIGLALILFISWQAIEWKTYDKDLYGYEALSVDEEDDEDIPITEQLKTPPPPPPPPAVLTYSLSSVTMSYAFPGVAKAASASAFACRTYQGSCARQ